MVLDDSERAHARRWVEHARNPNTESTPRAADAADAGEIELERRLGYLGIKKLLAEHQSWARQLTKRPGHRRRLGQELRERINFDELPSRIEVRQQEAETDGSPDDLSAKEVGDRRLTAGVEQLSEPQLRAAVESIVAINVDDDPDPRDRQDTDRTTMEGDSPREDLPFEREARGRRRENEARGPVYQER